MKPTIREYTVEELQALLIEHDGGVLKHGSHKRGNGSHKRGNGREFCGMEFVAKLAGEPWTDDPQCVHPALSAYVRAMNDASWPSDQERTRVLLPLIAKVFGTRHLKISVARIAEATIREIVPLALEAAAAGAIGDHGPKLLEAAKNCREAPSAADAAADAARAAADAARVAARVARVARAAAADAAYAAYAAYAANVAAYAREKSIAIVIAEIGRARADG